MPTLGNQRHELFAQQLATGKSASEAYVLAGYRPSRKNAARLRANDDIAARVAELQALAARSAEITIESICRELDEATAVAKARGQASAMVSASALRAKLAGLMVEKVEVGRVGEFDRCQSVEQIADEMLQYEPLFRPVTEQERQGLIDLLNEQGNAVQEYFAFLKAKPINAEPRHLQPTPHRLEHHGNGRHRRLGRVFEN